MAQRLSVDGHMVVYVGVRRPTFLGLGEEDRDEQLLRLFEQVDDGLVDGILVLAQPTVDVVADLCGHSNRSKRGDDEHSYLHICVFAVLQNAYSYVCVFLL